VKIGNVFAVDLSGQVHNLGLVCRILKHNYILGIKKYRAMMDFGETSFV